MIKETGLQFVIAVGFDKTAIILKLPEEHMQGLDGCFCDDNGFEGVPDKPGVYECSVDFWFPQGYSDGYTAPGESDWGFKITSFTLLAGLSTEKGAEG